MTAPPTFRQPDTRSTFARFVALPLFILVALGGGILVGASFPAGEWYQGLAKPWFNPPNWLFGPAWTLLYILIAIAGWRVWDRGLRRPLQIWIVQMAVNFCWSPVFFGAEMIGTALVVLVLMLTAILLFVAATWNRDRLAALLFLPYAGWTTFAGLLNASIWWLN